MFLFICMCGANATCVWVPAEARRGCWVFWSWSYRGCECPKWVLATDFGCTETTETSLQLLLLPSKSLCFVSSFPLFSCSSLPSANPVSQPVTTWRFHRKDHPIWALKRMWDAQDVSECARIRILICLSSFLVFRCVLCCSLCVVLCLWGQSSSNWNYVCIHVYMNVCMHVYMYVEICLSFVIITAFQERGR